MPYTQADLTTIYTNTQVGIAPSAAVSQLLAAYAAQNAAGTLTDAQVLNAVLALANPTTAVALETYQFFTGGTPTAAGLAFLVNSPTNATDLNDSYYAQFNTVNRFINFAANLGTGQGAGAAQFAASYGSLSLTDAVNVAYETIIGSGNATAAGFDPAAGKAYIASQIGYFQAFAKQNNPTATASQLDLIVKAEIVGYTLEEATKAGLGSYANATNNLLADLGPDNQANLGSNLLTSYGNTTGGAVTLTLGTDIANGNVFNAPVVTSATGDTRANTLQDEDTLTGTGTNPTLNFTFGNTGLNGGNVITPALRNIQTINVAFTGSGTEGGSNSSPVTLSAPVLDLQDATGVAALNISRISATNSSVSVVNLQAEPTISVTDTNAPASTVNIITTDQALQGAADTATITLNSAQIAGLVNRSGTGLGVSNTGGVESATLVSGAGTSTATNYVGELAMPGLQTLTITGASNLELGTKNVTTANLANNGFYAANPTANALGQAEASRFGAAFANEAGTLKTVDASGFTGASISVDLGPEVTGTSVQNSGGPINFTYKGSAGADTVRILGSVDAAGDNIDGGAGSNTLVFYNQGTQSIATGAAGSTPASTLTNFQALEVRAGSDVSADGETVSVDASAITGLTTILVRDEGQAQAVNKTSVSGLGGTVSGLTKGQFYSAPEGTVTVSLSNLTAAQATAITVQHSTTGNNAIAGAGLGNGTGDYNLDDVTGSTGFGANTGLIVAPVLATNTASDTVGITIQQNLNTDPRFNFTLAAGAGPNTVESLVLNDSDNESNTVALTNYKAHTGTVTIKGGAAGSFFNLDASGNLYALDEGGQQNDGTVNGTIQVGGNYVSPSTQTNVYNPGGIRDPGLTAVERLVATKIDASAEASDVMVRVSEGFGTTTGAQTILMGSGNDTVIFDAVSTIATPEQTAGLSISDTVKGGAGLDTLVIDGDVSNLVAASQHINIGASEWTNVSGFETLRMVGDAGITTASKFGGVASDAGGNAYNITLTNDFINANSVATAGVNRIAIINDNDPRNDAANTSNNIDTSPESGVTIDARSLVATNSFSYNGEEGTSQTADRFILSDANINGTALINGGAIRNSTTNNSGNNDVIEARNAAVVTIGDLANTSNVGTIEFTNDTAINQSSTLQLDSATVDRMVTSYHAAAAKAGDVERLTVHAIDNPTVAAATTGLNLDASQVAGAGSLALDVLLGRGLNTVVASAGNDIVTELGNYATGKYAGIRDGGNTTGPGQDTNLNIDSLANNQAGNRIVTDTLNGGDGKDTLNTYGNIDISKATITNFEGMTAHSNVVMTDAQYAEFGGVTFVGPGPHTLTITHDSSYTGAVDLSKTNFQGGDSSNETVTTDNSNGVVTTTGAPTYSGDTTAPTAPTNLALAPASDSGTAGDLVTKTQTVTVTGTAEANSTVKILDTDGTTVVGTGTADGSGAFSVTTSALSSNGAGGTVHTLTATATDPSGHTSVASSGTSGSLSVDVDTKAPPANTAATISSGNTGQSATPTVHVTFNPTAFTEANGVKGGTISLQDISNGYAVVGAHTLTSAEVDAGAADVAVTTALTSQGNHQLAPCMTDVAGNAAGSATTVTYNYDTTAPMLVPGASTPVDNGSASASGGQLTFTLHFNEAVTQTDITKLDVLDGNKGSTEISATYVSGSGTQDITYHIASGQYSDGDNIIINILDGYGQDAAGNHVVQVVGSSTYNFTAHT